MNNVESLYLHLFQHHVGILACCQYTVHMPLLLRRPLLQSYVGL